MAGRVRFDFSGVAKDLAGDDVFGDKPNCTWAYVLAKTILNHANQEDCDLHKLVLWAGDLRETSVLELDEADATVLRKLIKKANVQPGFKAELWAIVTKTE